MADISTLVVKVDTRDVTKAKAALESFAKTPPKVTTATSKLEKNFKSAFTSIQKGLLVTTAAITAFTAKSIYDFAQFETGMIGVQKTTDFTTTQMALFRSEVENIARTVPIATTELLGIATVAGQLGIKGVANITNFTKTLGKLQLATDVVGDEGAASIARLLTVVDEGYGGVERFGDVLVALGNDSAATENQILGLATEIAQSTSTMSVTSSDTLALGATLKTLGVRAELAGSVTGRAMRTIEKAINDGGESITQLSIVTGIAEKDLKGAFDESATTVFQKWTEGVGSLVKSGRTAESVLADFGLKGEEINKVLPTLAVHSELFAEKLALANKQLKDGGALQAEAAKATESLSSQWQLAKNRVSEITVAVGEGLAPVITDMLTSFGNWYDANELVIKQDIGGFIKNITPVVSALASTVQKLAQSMSGWAAVGSGDLGFFDFATMNAQELNEWLHKSGNGVIELESKLETLRIKQEEVRLSSAYKHEDVVAKQKKLEAIQEEIDLTKELITEVAYQEGVESRIDASKIVSSAKTIENIEKETQLITQSNKTQIALQEKLTKSQIAASAKLLEQKKKDAAAVLSLNTDLTDKVNALTMDELDYKLWALGEEEKILVAKAKGNKANLALIKTYYIAASNDLVKTAKEAAKKTEDVVKTSTEKMIEIGEDFKDEMQDALGDGLGDVFVEEFGGIEGAWGSMWDAMLSKMGNAVVDMSLIMAEDAVNSIFGTTFDYFHSGSTGIKDDEGFAVLQEGEMVIPSDASDQIRSNLGMTSGSGGSGGDFSGLVSATEGGGDWYSGNAFADNVISSYAGKGKKALTNAIMTGDVAGSMKTLMGPGTALNVLTSVGTSAIKDEMGVDGVYSDVGSGFGSLLSSLALSGTVAGPLGMLASSAFQLLGSYVGDSIGDGLDDREYEPLKDALEDNLITTSQYNAALADAVNTGMDSGSFLGSIGDAISSPFDAVGSFLSSGIDSIQSSWNSAFGDGNFVADSAMNDFGGFLGLGIGNPTSYGALSYDDVMSIAEENEKSGVTVQDAVDSYYGTSTYESAVASAKSRVAYGNLLDPASYASAKMQAALTEKYGSGWHRDENFNIVSSGNSGSGNSSSHESGYSTGTSGDGRTSHYATGGIVSDLMVPSGDDGFAALKFGEGVLDTDTMGVLKRNIRTGSMGSNDKLLSSILDAITAGSYEIAKNTLGTYKLIRKFDVIGVPETRTA